MVVSGNSDVFDPFQIVLLQIMRNQVSNCFGPLIGNSYFLTFRLGRVLDKILDIKYDYTVNLAGIDLSMTLKVFEKL